MAIDLAKVRRLQDALVRECQRYSLEEAMNALAAVSAAALATAPKYARENIFNVFNRAIVASVVQIDKGADPLLTEKRIQ
ncbi:MAG: hypothetical protein KGL39_59615 [Patescibacteria group bacterium]|nr:hypothetical protein [Patescibacteria group bacterium]